MQPYQEQYVQNAREIAREILGATNAEIDAAEDGKQAVERFEGAPEGWYSLVLMDVQMPVMDGYAATREIRKLREPFQFNIPVVAMTANAFEEDRRAALDAGMDEHVAKPLDVEKLKYILARFIKK